MAEAFNPYRFLWWRFSEYELKDEYICPTPGAKLELYDPWQLYRDSWEYDPDSATPFAEKRQKDPPYISLFDLVEEMEPSSDSVPINKRSVEKLLKWCSKFGLLGLLPQRVQMVAVAPRWLPENPWGAAVGINLKRPKGGLLYPTQFIYYRNNAVLLNVEGAKVQGWNPFLWQGRNLGQKGKRLGQIYDSETQVHPGVTIQGRYFESGDGPPNVIRVPTLFQESFQYTWSKYFPSIPKKEVETYLYPPPLSPPFWKIYSEKWWHFFRGVFDLQDALLYLNESADYSDKQSKTNRSKGFSLLNDLVSSSSMVLGTNRDGSYRQEWRAASLLGCFAMMALQDLTQHRKVMSCERCNRLFVTEAYQARYCSDRCRHTAQKRRYRQKLKEEKDNG